MMIKAIADGVWPTMVTPFNDNNEIDYDGVRQIIDWYERQGVAGIFAVCQSSEMTYLSIEERVSLAKFIVSNTPPHMRVIASGHVADDPDTQIEDAKRVIDTGVDAYVFITGRLAAKSDSDDVMLHNLDYVINGIGSDVTFGLYECPAPYHRLLPPDTLKRIAELGQFAFLKDTCCDAGLIAEKLKAIEGTALKLFNANTATLLDSLRHGAAGYSGLMANFHADIYVWLCANYAKFPEKARQFQAIAGALSTMQYQQFPTNAKYHMTLEGINIGITSRSRDAAQFGGGARMEVDQLHDTYQLLKPLLFSPDIIQ